MRIATLIVFCLTRWALGAELRVGPQEQFPNIPAALAQAQPGDRIWVGPGAYDGNLLLAKTIELVGVGYPLIRGTGSGSTITIRANGCTIKGFRIEHSGSSLMDEDAGILLHSNDNRIVDNQLSDILFGIYFFNSNDNVVRGNVIRGRIGIEQGERGAGLHFWNCLRNIIEQNTISATRDGMYLQNASESTIRNNRVTSVRYGLHYMYSNDNVFEDNVFENSIAGAAIMYSTRIQLRRNRFVHNRGFSSFGILFQDSTAIVAEQNIIADNGSGIFAESLRGSTLRRNLISGNDAAVEMFASAEGNEFTGNNFIANLTPIHIIGSTTSTRWSTRGRGNYWSEYDGYDLDGDGVGDVPFHIRNLYEKLESNHPRLRVYFQSPAAQALVAAERAFPIMRSASETDEHPLMRPVDIGIPVSERTPRGDPVAAASMAAGVSILTGVFVLRRKRGLA